jgi:Ca2+-binding RTX toxin-like protein
LTIYSCEVLRELNGVLTVATLQIIDDDDVMESGEIGAEWILDGISLGPDAPLLERTQVTFDLRDGGAGAATCAVFTAPDGSEVFVPTIFFDVNLATARTGNTLILPFGPTPYVQHALVDPDAAVFTGNVLVVQTPPSGGPTYARQSLTVWDDDGTVEEAAGEVADPAAGLIAAIVLDLAAASLDLAAPNLARVTVGYDDTGDGLEDGSFDAIAISAEYGGSAYTWYLPATADDVGINSIVSVTSVAILGLATGLAWADYNLSYDPEKTKGDGADDDLRGSFINDELIGKGSADSLYGAQGADELNGGGGGDTLFGGAGFDDLDGGSGGDVLEGGLLADVLDGGGGGDSVAGGQGADDIAGGGGGDTLGGGIGSDSLAGDGGGDEVSGNGGNDRVAGGSGRDTLAGGSGADTLEDGSGRDVLDGGSGADIFLVLEDGDIDEIVDFEDGTDLIDIGGLAFTATDVAPGVVDVLYGSDTLRISNGLATLTAADITAADFV